MSHHVQLIIVTLNEARGESGVEHPRRELHDRVLGQAVQGSDSSACFLDSDWRNGVKPSL